MPDHRDSVSVHAGPTAESFNDLGQRKMPDMSRSPGHNFSLIICAVALQLLLGSCSKYTYQERSPRTLTEPVYLMRTDDHVVRPVTDNPDVRYFAFDENGGLSEELTITDQSQGLTLSDAPQVRLAAVVGSDTLIVADRRIIEEATNNLRDLGGLIYQGWLPGKMGHALSL